MPHSTGSSDSGYGCVVRGKSTKFNVVDGSTTSSDRATSSITDDDEQPVRCAVRCGPSFSRTTRGKSRRLRKKPAPVSDTSSHSSCSSSELNSLTGEEDRRHTLSREDIIKKVYVYFQSLLVTVQRQQKFFEQIGGLMADADARWGAGGGLRKGWVDPAGCFAPYGFGDPSKPAAFPGCWAVPHPAVHLALLASNLRDYLDFLSWLYPGVVGCGVGGSTATGAGARSGVDDVSQQRARGGSDHAVSDDILPILMQLMQQMTPMNAAAAAAAAAAVPQAPIDDALLRQEKMRQHLQQAAAAQTTAGWSVQPAVMQQLMTQLSQMQLIQQQQQQNQQSAAAAAAAAAVAAAPVVVTKKTSSTAPPSMVHLSPTKSATTAATGDSAQRPPSEYYSAVVARRSPTYGETSTASTKTNVSSSATMRSSVAPQKLERKVRCSTTATEAVPLSNAVATTTTSVRVDVKTPCESSFDLGS
ncbi:hypothetical protein Q1695_010421 [Nippostrongylus brasiliensis]|nr:hypothetical protein Q1695_010421 [Nippostrongylus brasiliensis]